MTVRLATLLDGLAVAEVIGGDAALVEVTSLTQDSSAVVAGSLYCCVRGARTDGHDLAARVTEAGAGSLLVERRVDASVPQVLVASVRRSIGPLAAAFWGRPSDRLRVVGVTGTNGKTTTTALLGAILVAAGRSVEVLGTLSGPHTTPEAPVLQERLARALGAGGQDVVMEVSSIALDQHRSDGIAFAAAVWTNLSQDHLDYHGSMESYFVAKARLFEPGRCGAAVVNRDDVWGKRLARALETPVVTYGLEDADRLQIGAVRSRFRWRGREVEIPLGGAHNVANALAAATAADVLGVDPAVVAAGLCSAPVIPGRWEVVAARPFTVIVDYAHTPDGLEQVLTAARRSLTADARLLVVFGCGGDRDAAKRPLMAAAATRLADVAVLTSDNPRSEDPLVIIAEARVGALPGRALVVEPDRAIAIAAAFDRARAGDLVVIAGKGHETHQVVGDRAIPFDDRAVARRLLGTRDRR